MFKRKKILNISIVLLFSCILLAPFAGSAQTAKELFNQGLDNTAQGTGHTGGEEGGRLVFQDMELPEVIGLVINILLSLLGVFFLALVIYGGYLWMTDRGNEQQVSKAKAVITRAFIGLIVILAAFALTNLILSSFFDNSP